MSIWEAKMKTFEKAAFQGTFRDYQQAVLDNSKKHLADGRIHIVAAPGSGKTILGLELMRRLAEPALILSPSVTIRSQWGDRFSMYLPQGEDKDDYVSFDLFNPKLLTSITYQALHAALNRAVSSDEDDDGEACGEQDFSGFDLFAAVRAAGIKTICLDEAHHLRSEWQKALEAFIQKVGGSMKIIALTATPPYDSTPAEWKRYLAVCGEVDEEIFVPQLVAQKTLCPHQDYIYFNYPTEAETEILKAHRIKAAKCAREIISGTLPDELLACADSRALEADSARDREGAAALLSLFNARNARADSRLGKLRDMVGSVPELNLTQAEKAFTFLLESECFAEDIREKLRARLAEDGLIEKKKVCIVSTDKINKMLISSIGKLQSINAIVAEEARAMGDKLRMLILTDYIKKDMLKSIGTDEALGTMGTVPIFESIRRSVGNGTRIALLSGSLVILPSSAAVEVITLAAEDGVKCSARPLNAPGYSEITFSGSNKSRVAVLTEAFGRGCFNVLIGTKSLLGEGWDSPCINSLILASFVGSFMLSNQMRGRAIRTDKNVPDKASSIWHLVTVEPEFEQSGEKITLSCADSDTVSGSDYATCRRRFTCFLGPSYEREVIESGIERLEIIRPPYDKKGIESINAQMLSLSSDRSGMTAKWLNALGGSTHQEVLDVVSVPGNFIPASFFAAIKTAAIVTGAVTLALLIAVFIVGSTALKVLLALAAGVSAVFFIKKLVRFLKAGTPEKASGRAAQAVLKGLAEQKALESRKAKAFTQINPNGGELLIMLSDATVHEKRAFSQAMSELFSAIDDPRYLLIRSGNDYGFSFACPNAFDSKKETAEMFAAYFSKTFGKCAAVYTRSDSGKDCLSKCRKKSFLNKRNITARSKKTVRPM